ncbi:MAG: ABC transporter permease [Mediterranea sp.]|nr:ABC transporter permease [Mediterranea sp.]
MIEIWQEIYSNLRRNKLRTFLTGFAVAWGIFMLIVLLGSGNGLIHAFAANSGEMAMNSVRVTGGWTNKAYDGLKEGRHVQLDNKDLGITATRFSEHVISTGARVRQSGIILSKGAEYVSTSFSGVFPNYVDIERIKLASGRFINNIDLKEHRKVIVLNTKTVELLFPKGEAIGQFVSGNGITYQVVGVYTDRGDSDSREAYIPFSTLQIIYNKGDKLDNLFFTIKDLNTEEENNAFVEQYRKAINANHRVDPTDIGGLWIWNRFMQYLQQQTATVVLRLAIWIIGVFTLLSGIVGVSNIMLITVRERTREFGIRKALGAKPHSILFLVVVESVFITALFGYIGMVLGIGVTELMNMVVGNQTMDTGMWQETVFTNPTVGVDVAVQATLTLVIAGTLAGLFPAWKAVNISPIEALRAD